jgi:ribosomal protein L7Ae-like RNA K-turn-binding protein
MNNKILNLLGFAKKAGKIISGENTVDTFLKRNKKKLSLVIIAEDMSCESKNKYILKLKNNNIKYIIMFDKEILGNSIGKSSRAIVGICDKGFAEKIKNIMEEKLCDK